MSPPTLGDGDGQPSFASIGRAILDCALPRRCAVCGDFLAGFARTEPLCPACRLSLRPLSGRRCPRCGDMLISEELLCMRCRSRTASLDEALPLFRFDGGFRRILSAYKFGDRRSFAPFLAELAGRAILERWPGRALVPVPPRPGKLRERGWDQVEDLAKALERRGFAVERILERLPSQQQKRLGRSARGINARAAYRLKARAVVPESAVLLDDVVTTGATAEACAAALKEGGARWVALLALAAD